MQTLAEVKDNIGKTGTVELSGLKVEVKIQDITIGFGKIRYQVSPLSGSGSVWINSDKLTLG